MHADAPTNQASAARRADHATIFLTSLAVIVFQIALTRVLSVVVWYHYAFLTLSLVMMGPPHRDRRSGWGQGHPLCAAGGQHADRRDRNQPRHHRSGLPQVRRRLGRHLPSAWGAGDRG